MDRRKADKVADELLRQIVVGDWALGEILPKEAELAAQYQVNRSVIREAIKLLEVHRLVKPVRRKGTEVLNPVMSLSPEVIRVMIQPRPGQINTEVLHDLLEIRAELDAQLSVLAAKRRSEEDLALFDSYIRKLESLLDLPLQYSNEFDQLALAIARSTKNRIFEMLVHWHHRIQQDLGDLLLSVRFATHKHIQGVRFVVELIRRQDVESVHTAVAAFHQWASPRIITYAEMRSAVASGSPLFIKEAS